MPTRFSPSRPQRASRRTPVSHGASRSASPGDRPRRPVLVAAVALAALGVATATVALDTAAPEQAYSAQSLSARPGTDGGAVDRGSVAQIIASRGPAVSRSASDRVIEASQMRRAGLSLGGGHAVTRHVDDTPSDPHVLAKMLLPEYGFSSSQYSCLEQAWDRESGWDVYATNPGSGAYGIPQSLPGSKMASAGADWRTSAETQIRWGLTYIRDTYGSPCSALAAQQAQGWY